MPRIPEVLFRTSRDCAGIDIIVDAWAPSLRELCFKLTLSLVCEMEQNSNLGRFVARDFPEL